MKQEPVSPRELPGQPCYVSDLKNKLAELEEKIKQLETGAFKQIAATAEGEAVVSSSAMETRIAELESRFGVLSESSLSVAGLENALKQMFANTDGGLGALLAEYRSSWENKIVKLTELVKELVLIIKHNRQESSDAAAELEFRVINLVEEERRRYESAEAEAAGMLNKLKQEEGALKAVVDKVTPDMLILKKDMVESVNNVVTEWNERMEVIAGKMQGDIMSAAREKFSGLRTSWETARIEIQNAQKTAYCALEKCEKLDKALSFLDIKTGVLERKYSRCISELPKPDISSGEL